MNKSKAMLGTLVVIIAIGLLFFYNAKEKSPSSAPQGVSQYKDLVRLSEPVAGQVLTNPFWVRGEARGGWFFEANFPIALISDDGRELASGIAQAQASWMTSEYVPFRAELTIPGQTKGTSAKLIIKKANPSGRPDLGDSFEIPVKF